MSSITKSSNVVGSTFIVILCDLDQDKSTVSFVLTKNNQQCFFLNFVSPLLKHQAFESYNVFVNLPKSVRKTLMDK